MEGGLVMKVVNEVPNGVTQELVVYAQKVGRAQEDCGIRSITAIVIVQATEMQPLTQTIITLMLRKTLCNIT